MFKKITVVFTLLIMSLTVLACDKVAGISGDTKISELSEEESGDFCVHLDSVIEKVSSDDDIKKGSCLMSGAMSASFGVEGEDEQIAACETGFEECMEKEDEDDDFSFADNCFDEDDRDGCEATVKEVDACFAAMFEAQFEEIKALAGHDCEELMTTDILDDMMAGMGDEDEIEECKIVEEKCEMM